MGACPLKTKMAQGRCFYEACTVKAKMVATEAFLSSLGKGLDWIRDTEPPREDLGNVLVREKTPNDWEVDWLV